MSYVAFGRKNEDTAASSSQDGRLQRVKEPECALFALVSFFGGIGTHHMSQRLQPLETIADRTTPCWSGLFIPFLYITQYFRENVGGISDELAFWMLPLLEVGSVFGRTISAIVADVAGNLNVLACCTIVSALLGFCWIADDSVAGVISWSLFYGCFSGAFVSLQVPTVVSITKDHKTIGGRAGYLIFPRPISIYPYAYLRFRKVILSGHLLF